MAGTFNFPNHKLSTIYQSDGTAAQFGGGWQFAAQPHTPIQRIYVLSMLGLQYFVDVNGNLDLTISPTRNAGVFEQFYETNRMWQKFIYPHPYRGNINVRFSAPISMPTGISGGTGILPSFDINFVEDLS